MTKASWKDYIENDSTLIKLKQQKYNKIFQDYVHIKTATKKKKAEIYKHNFKIVLTIYQRQEKEHKCNGIVNVLVLNVTVEL